MTDIFAQESINAGGGTIESSGGNISFTVGQVAFLYSSGPAGSVQQGIQAPFEIFVIDSNKNNSDISLSAYPNPTSNFLNLKLDQESPRNILACLFDINGRLLIQKKSNLNKIDFDLSGLPVGGYYLKLMEGVKNIKTFKIIKK